MTNKVAGVGLVSRERATESVTSAPSRAAYQRYQESAPIIGEPSGCCERRTESPTYKASIDSCVVRKSERALKLRLCIQFECIKIKLAIMKMSP